MQRGTAVALLRGQRQLQAGGIRNKEGAGNIAKT